MSHAPTRRRFLQSAAALASGPVILGASNKSGSAPPIVGQGEFKYEVIHDWGELPKSISYGNTHGVVEDAHGFIYVHHTVNASSESSDSMVVFDPKGKFVKSWGKEFRGGAHGLHIAKEGKDQFLYLCDTKRALVVKSTLAGEEVWSVGYPKESKAYEPGADGKPKKYSPTNLAIAPNGDIYVGDGYGSSYINVYDPKGEYKFTFGGPGKEAGQLLCPHGITIDTRGAEAMVLVADRTNNRLQRFSLDGKHIGFDHGVKLPCHFHERKGVMVIPDLQSRVTLIGRDNQVIEHLGDNSEVSYNDIRKKPREAFTPGKFVCPHGACFDHKGNIFVVEWVEAGRVTKLRKV